MKFGKTFLAAAVLAVMAFSTVPASAIEGDWWIMKPVEKRSRGIANVAFGPLEVFISMWDVQQEDGGIAGLTYGTLRGVVRTIGREVVGVVDIVTFPFPLPDCPENPEGYGWGYGPIMRPAWVVDLKHDWNNFVYDREAVVNSSF